MNLRHQKKFIRNMIRLFCMILMVTAMVFTISFIFSIRPPEGNATLNISAQEDTDIEGDGYDLQNDSEDSDQVYTFIVAGKDVAAYNTDIIMLVKFDTGKKKIDILNIPRDTMVNTNRKVKKINASYHSGGIEKFEEDVASLTGFYVNRYVIFDIKGVEEVIDAIGGIDFYVPRNMHYDDPTQNLHIHFNEGYQHLSGADVVKIARYRSGYFNGDIGRIEVQQKLLKSIAEQALKPENILKIPEIASIITKNMETDIELGNMIWLANKAKDMNLGDIETHLLPGVDAMIDGLSYWLPYKNELLDLLNSKFNPKDKPITEDDISIVTYPANEGK
ncbi:MAG: LCP family protein [Clostridiaceae bacterium]|nr:LCP family protein [Clostridiaceae bacterium]